MIFKSQIVTSASGSIGGITYSHNAGGMYTRGRAIPTNPNTTQQQAVRGFFSALAVLWSSTLTAAQRTAWSTYAANVTILNKLGDPINISGLAMYQRSNTPLLQSGGTRVDDGPLLFTLPSMTNPTFALDEPNDEVDVTYDNTDLWANETGGHMLVYCSRPQAPTVNYFKGPYRFAGTIDGAETPPTSPEAIPLPFAVGVGQRIFVMVRVVRADGRLSYPFRGQADA